MTNVTAVTERRKQNQYSRRPAQKNAVRSRLRRSAAFRISDSMEQGLIGKCVVPQLVNNFLAFYVAQRFTTAFTTLRHLTLSLARSIRSAPTHTTCIYIFHRLWHFKGPIQVWGLVSIFQYAVFIYFLPRGIISPLSAVNILPATIHIWRSVQQTRHAVVTETHSSFVQNTSQVIVTHHLRQHEELLVKVTSRCAVADLSIIGKARSAYITSSPLVTAKRLTVFQFNNCPTKCDLFSLLHFCRQLYMFRVLTPIIRSWYSCNYSFWY